MEKIQIESIIYEHDYSDTEKIDRLWGLIQEPAQEPHKQTFTDDDFLGKEPEQVEEISITIVKDGYHMKDTFVITIPKELIRLVKKLGEKK